MSRASLPRSALVAMAAQAAVMAVFALLMLFTADEDAPAFNCYLAGNHVCGPGAADGNLGFVNLFTDAS